MRGERDVPRFEMGSMRGVSFRAYPEVRTKEMHTPWSMDADQHEHEQEKSVSREGELTCAR